MHALVGDGVTELQHLGMEVQAVGRLAVQAVALDGAVHAVGVGGVYAQLVGAACFGVIGDAGGFLQWGRLSVIPLLRGARGV